MSEPNYNLEHTSPDDLRRLREAIEVEWHRRGALSIEGPFKPAETAADALYNQRDNHRVTRGAGAATMLGAGRLSPPPTKALTPQAPIPTITALISTLGQNAQELFSLVSELEERLAFVIAPSGPGPERDRMPANTAVGEGLSALHYDLGQLATRLRALIERVAL